MKVFSLKNIVFLIIFLVISCQKKVNNSDIKDELYFALLKYQNDYPIDNSKIDAKTYYYAVSIVPKGFANIEDENDNLYIHLTNEKFMVKNIFGVYEGLDLKRTIIFDDAKMADRFLKKKISINLSKFGRNQAKETEKYPVYIYNIDGNKLGGFTELNFK